jgi:putative GTP pyrophosphokinase
MQLENQPSQNKASKVNDYVSSPKSSGYRSIHFIYNYNSKVEAYDQLRVELQIRTKLQHNWATAVETAGIITKTSLKSSKGPDEWLDFFQVVSSLFAIKENLPVLDIHEKDSMEELMVQCYNYCTNLKIIETLKALRVTTEHLEKQKFPGDYYLIHIDIAKQLVSLNVFKKSDYNVATESYLEIERKIDDTNSAVVLVSANSFKDLKRAYPSYFLDTSEFLTALDKMNKNCIDRKLIKNVG